MFEDLKYLQEKEKGKSSGKLGSKKVKHDMFWK